ncbi:ribonuclease HIII [Saliterribacillus persicus]|uniref:Ribonuclease HIII n=1 Tax=Saliterribacillus persicus TaxID=930114 RepID=A0A368XH49_9BACI|nr:ribonuclease HIII [Saliterribacillus persicus]RCW66348.1 ribonuclease HIII [Saliterribacillus persicus]
MANVVLKLPINEIKKIENHYKKQSITPPQYATFAAKVNGTNVTVYKSGKVMFQGRDAEKEASMWQGKSEALPTKKANKKSVNEHSFYPPNHFFETSHIGSDEAGTGDYFGPITVAAVFIPKEKIALIKELGVRDSKDLKDPMIERIAKDLVYAEIPYTLMTLKNEKYNQLQRKGWNQGKMKAMLHYHAIQKLLDKLKGTTIDGILIDQFCQPQVHQKYLRTEKLTLQPDTYFMTKAESHSLSVAAASIIARAKFVKEMDKLSKESGITIPKGASNKVDQTAAYLVKKYGKDVLEKYAKLHFANTEKANKYL